MILLDTNVISELMKALPDLRVLNWLDSNTGEGLFISAISQAEIALGIVVANRQTSGRIGCDCHVCRRFCRCEPFD